MTQKEDDHDLLIEINQNLKHLVENFDKHVKEDSDLSKKVENHQKIVYMGMGAFALFELLTRFAK